MILRNQPPLQLTYCLNVHPGESWEENLEAIRAHTLVIRDRVASDTPFGLGLRLSRMAAETLSQPETIAGFRAFMKDNNLYAFTINGFPYGAFHGKPVKTEVYRPDWSTRERLDYTVLLANILGQLLPEGMEGSISTVPLGYRGAVSAQHKLSIRDPKLGTLHLAECAFALHTLHNTTGREIHIGLEPEPDCLLETTEEVIQFFEGPLREHGVPHLAARLNCDPGSAETILRRHIGICFDTCHLAIQFETLADSLTRLIRHGIRISKVQLSSALEVVANKPARQRLAEFLDPVYLHQVKAIPFSSPLTKNKEPIAPTPYPDLPDALLHDAESCLWRIHFHLPLYFEGDGVIHSTAGAMDSKFWDTMRTSPVSHLEIETYTFNVLPLEMRADGIASSISREYGWVMKKIQQAE